jgi:hypothetical protein
MEPKPEVIDPAFNAPTLVSDEAITPEPNVLFESTLVPFIWNTLPDDKFRLPVDVTVPEPFNGDKVILPVVAPPRVRFWLAVVWSVPSAAIYAAPAEPAETEAVGVPELTLRTANLAEEEAAPPTKRSVELLLV